MKHGMRKQIYASFHATFRCFIFNLHIFIYFLYIYDIIETL